MCRAKHDGGRRCPACTDPARRPLARIRQRIGRYDRAARRANEAEDWDTLLRYVELLDRDVAAHEAATAAATEPPASLPPSRAAEFTPAATVDLSDDQLAAALAELDDDPRAQEQVLDTLEWRDQLAQQRDAEIAAHEQEQERQRREREAAWQAAAEAEDASPLTNPARRPSRQLSAEQTCREEYDVHTYTSYLDAETECRGQLLNREGLARGIDPLSLFSGPAARARKYSSEELRAWWARNGRITYTEWRYQWLGRDSDREAARTAKFQSLGEATA
ncbi:hypothetical protein [Amycolatopsis keratiniphila]|nr:hypothetical protein [Amycolatopsis keratiniphila]